MSKKNLYDGIGSEYDEESIFADWKEVAGAIAVGAVLCFSSLYVRPFCMVVYGNPGMCDAYQSDLPSFLQK